jgi:serine/tyrosine/threonine adenylyltransferase
MYARVRPEVAPSPELLAYNDDLADELGIVGRPNNSELAALFSGHKVPIGADPIASAYAGHQFGNFVPSLGDGRAVLLGEVIDINGLRRDVQLKGSGRTAFSRGGDGKAWIGPVLREYVVSEAMHHLGIPTTRALAAVKTGEKIVRAEGGVPGGVITRVASSHIRVGTFQYFAARRDIDALKALFEHAVERHYPECSTPLDFLNAVITRQASLVAKWLGVGFIHGVMNTDNTAISGETIDYGPCAFMDRYHPATVFSSIDRHGRYAYMSQPDIIVWNIAQLASSLLFLETDQDAAIDIFTQAIHKMPDIIDTQRREVFGAKLGIRNPTREDGQLVDELLSIMSDTQADFTNTFRNLATGTTDEFLAKSPGYEGWLSNWSKRLETENDPTALMTLSNPAYIPRNHRIEQMIQSALQDDFAPLNRLLSVLSDPYNEQDGADDLALPPQPDEEIEATFCGT